MHFAVKLLFSLVAAHYFYRIWNNWRIARRLNLPIVFSPFNPYGVFWSLLQNQLMPIFRLLPEPFSTFCRVTYVGWEYADHGQIHEKLGSAFVLVSPGRNEIVLSDPNSVHEALTKYKVFRKPKLYELHDIFGRNVNTTNDEVWARHRKITAPCFNERVSQTVWDEASRQAQSLLDQASNTQTADVYTKLVNDTKVVALHVLMGAGLGKFQPFRGGVREATPGHALPFGEALTHLVENIVIALIFGPLCKPWLLPLLPKSLKDTHIASEECRQYFDEMVDEQRTGQKESQNNLVGALVRASNEADEERGQGYGSGGLTKDEMRGNLYIFTFAGHETTANTMAYAVALLAAYPRWQDWIQEEIDAVVGVDSPAGYEAFPKLKRCQALMHEVLRLYGPVVWIPRETTKEPTSLSSQNLEIPPDTDVHLNMYTRQVTNEIWGIGAPFFTPERFIISPGKPVPTGWIEHGGAGHNEEKLVTPPLSHFSPWSLGARICPGMKFSQVEFVSAISTLFSQARVIPAPSETVICDPPRDEAGHYAYVELRTTIEDSAFRGSTLAIKRPEKIRLVWKSRK